MHVNYVLYSIQRRIHIPYIKELLLQQARDKKKGSNHFENFWCVSINKRDLTKVTIKPFFESYTSHILTKKYHQPVDVDIIQKLSK